MSSSNVAISVSQNQNLTDFNTLGLHSTADKYFDLKEKKQLNELADYLTEAFLLDEIFILGGGSNVVLPQRVRRFVIHNRLKGIELLAEKNSYFLVKAAGGEVWHDFVHHCLNQGWHGLENLALIPGAVGAAPVQNIGAYGKEIKDFCHEVEVFDFKTKTFFTLTNEQCHFAYRDSYFKHKGKELLIVSVTFKLPRPWRAQIDYPDLQKILDSVESGKIESVTPQQVFDQVCAIRQFKLPDPAIVGNAGSFFKNPIISTEHYHQLNAIYSDMPSYKQADGRYKLAAAWLIDQSGWKGREYGRAGVHHRQALVLINREGAVAEDIQKLAEAIQRDVYEKFNVRLEPEPVFVQ